MSQCLLSLHLNTGVLAETAGACTAGKPVVDKGKGQPRAQDVTNVGLQLQRSMSQERLLTCSRTLLLNSAPTLSNALAAVSQSIAAMISDEKRACGKTTLDISLCDEAFSRLNAHVSTVLAAYAQAGNQDWRQYAAFNAHHYVRHLLDANDDYELLVNCVRCFPHRMDAAHHGTFGGVVDYHMY